MNTYGLFFVKPDEHQFQIAYDAINKREPYQFNDVHVACHIILVFCKELPRSILPTSMYHDYLHGDQSANYSNDLMINILRTMAGNYRILLAYLMGVLKKVFDHQPEGFTVNGIARVFFYVLIVWVLFFHKILYNTRQQITIRVGNESYMTSR